MARVVIIAIDGSEHSTAAFDYYLNNVHKEDNHLIIQQVVELPEMHHARENNLYPHTLQEMWEEAKQKAILIKKEIEERLKSKNVTENVKYRLDHGQKPGHVICDVAKQEKANMIVMGTRGMGTVRRALVGSVSDYVVHHAHCPTVVCRHAIEELQAEAGKQIFEPQ